MTHLDPNDPRFTAKALGEAEPENISPEANEEFESLQDFAATLKSELKARDEKDALTAEQKERVRNAIEPQQKKTILKFPVWINAVAACLVLGLVGIIAFRATEESRKQPMLAENAVAEQSTGKGAVQPTTPGRRGDMEIPEIVVDLPEARDREADNSTVAGASENEIVDLEPYVLEDSLIVEYERPAAMTGNYVKRFDLPVDEADAELTTKFRSDEDAKDALDVSPPKPSEVVTFDMKQESKEGYVATSTLGGTSPSEGRMKQPVPASQPRRASSATLRQEPERILSYTDTPTTLLNLKRQEEWNREAYDRIVENGFKNPTDHPLSTFSIDVDTASYANVRRYLNSNQLPPADAVRIEEMINYFSYDYAGPDDEVPFAVHVDAASTPWNEKHRLVRIALQGETMDLSERPDANLVFLIDVSGSMSDQNKLPLVQQSLNLLVDQMEARDRIAVVVYAGASGLALPSTTANNKETIQHAISNLRSGGSTNGGAGIELAYSVAQKHFIQDGINRVILCTDGDFNVGTTNRGSLTRMIEEKAKTGVFFSVLGFGMGNYQDATMEELSNKGNGNYSYVDSFKEARKVFVDEMLGTLYTIAKDVKIQVEFNPQHVSSYRLIGYENRMLAKEDFNDDKKDAGEIGAGHRVTALYEVIPTGVETPEIPSVDALKYQRPAETSVKSTELLTVKLRYKQPDEDTSSLIEVPFTDTGDSLANASDDFRFATSVAGFGMLLRKSELANGLTLEDVRDLAAKAKGNDSGGLRSEFVELVEKAIALTPKENR